MLQRKMPFEPTAEKQNPDPEEEAPPEDPSLPATCILSGHMS
jgi:hypothetical protein